MRNINWSRCRRYAAGIVALAVMPGASPVIAQDTQTPGSLQQQRIEDDRRRQELEQRLRQQKPDEDPVSGTPLPAPTTLPESESAARFRLNGVQFSKSELLTRAELDAAIANYVGRDVSFADLNELIAVLNGIYKAKGIITAQAVLPLQEIDAGILQILLVESRLGAINISGNATTRSSYVLDRIDQQEGELFDLVVWGDRLRLINRNSDIVVSAELAAGDEFGSTAVDLLVREPKQHTLTLALDNRGSRSTGTDHGSLTYRNASLTGRRDALVVGGGVAEGSNEISAQYGFPINTTGGYINLSSVYSEIEVIDGPTRDLDVTGESASIRSEVVQPVFIDEYWRIQLLAGLAWRESSTDIASVTIADTDYTAFTYGALFERLDDIGSWYSEHQITYADKAISQGDRASIYRGSLTRVQQLSDTLSFYANITAQYTKENLIPSGEQFQIGGAGTVRGYDEGMLIGNEGYYVNLDLIGKLDVIGTDDMNWQAYAFFDFGRIPDSDVAEELSGAGVGLRVFRGTGMTADLAAAAPLKDLENYDKDIKLHLRMSFNFL